MSLTRFSRTRSLVCAPLGVAALLAFVGLAGDASAGPVTVSANTSHSCAVTASGGVRCWGRNSEGQLGDGTIVSRSHPAPVLGLAGVTAVAVGGFHTCALTAGGGVKCWGSNASGQLGDGSQTTRRTPVDVSGLVNGIVAIAAGSNHTCAVTAAGAVKCWGENSTGELGIGAVSLPWTTPVDVSGLSSGATTLIASWERHTCVSLRGGLLRCWGYNNEGQLGDGSTTNRPAPIDVVGVSAPTALAVGWGHSCAVEQRGGVKCWGYNGTGQLGDGTTTNHYLPAPVTGLASGVIGLAAGSAHTCAMMADGTLACWGYDGDGQLGDGNRGTSRPVPAAATHVSGATVTDVAAGTAHTCAVTGGWRVVCWGYNDEGQLGLGASRALMPKGVFGLAAGAAGIGAGQAHACAVAGGRVKCWGDNGAGQLGDGTRTNRMAPVDVVGLSEVIQVANGEVFSCALTAGGGVKCWGSNSFGQLGDGTQTARPVPTDVAGLTAGVTAIAAGASHVCALTAAGGVRCWGWNGYGQLGDGTTANQLTPVNVSGLTSGTARIAAGGMHTCAVSAGGGVKCWGFNSMGQLGDGTTTERHTPVDVSGLATGAASIAAGREHTCALTVAGGIKCWGQNWNGEVGDNTRTARNVPVDVTGISSGATVVTAGSYHTCAAMAAGAIKCWGANDSGQIGDGDPASPTSHLVPADVSGLTGAVALAAGGAFTCAIAGGGAVQCWGTNALGQLGDGTGVDGLAPVFVPGFGAATDFSDDGKADIITRNRVTGQIGFWLMNGTSIAREDRIAGPQDPNWQIVVAADFNGDGKSDLLWRNRATGENIVWFMNGTTYVNYTRMRDVPDPNWQMVAAADFDLDGKPDLLWRNQATGENVIWLMNGTEYRGYVRLQTVADKTWTIIAADDFDGNNQPEIMWFNASTRQIILWHMNGAAFASYETVTYIEAGWQAMGSGDTNGDDCADILWHNPATGQNAIWRMNGAQHLGTVFPPSLNDPEWEVMRIIGIVRPGPGDFNLDGSADIVWHNLSTGMNRIWYMSAATLAWDFALAYGSLDLAWRLSGIGDLNGDQKQDLVWRNISTGEIRYWQMTGATLTSSVSIATLDVKWEIVAVGDFNGDGKGDLVFRHSDTGENVIWFMDGPNRIGYTRFANVPDVTWRIVGTGDFNGDGQTDIVWRNAVSGQNVVWLMNGATMSSYVVLQTVADPRWTIASVRDFNGDGKPDLLWRSTGGVDTGRNIIWFMNGTSLASYSDIQSETDLNWVPK